MSNPLLSLGVAGALLSGAGATVPTVAAADELPKAVVCTACHGPDGNSTMPETPSLAGQNARYVYLQLRDFQEGRRVNVFMTAVTTGMSRDDMHELADFFSQQKLSSKNFKADPAKAELGRKKADETLCAMCHLGEFVGQNEIPKVAGQNYDYVVKTLRDFKARNRTNDAGNMTSVASTLSDEDIVNLGHYISGLN